MNFSVKKKFNEPEYQLVSLPLMFYKYQLFCAMLLSVSILVSMKGKLNFETFDLFESSHNSCCELKMKLSSNIGRKKHSEVLPLKDILLDWNNFKIGH